MHKHKLIELQKIVEEKIGSLRLMDLSPNMIYPMHGSCIENSTFPKYFDAIMKNDFAYTDMLLGRKIEAIS